MQDRIDPLADAELDVLRALVARLGGAAGASRVLGVPRTALVSVLARVPVRLGTIAVLRAALDAQAGEERRA